MRRFFFGLAFTTLVLGPAVAADPPGLLSYQGVLRSAADLPLNGTYDMIFRFVDAPSGGTLLLTDLHTGPNGVVVTGGLFTTYLGGGTLSPGTEATLAAVFANRTSVYVEVQVGAETLSPRVQVVSAGFALNAGRVGGQVAGDFLDKSATAQTKLGQLTASGGLIGTGAGASNGVEGTTATGAGVKGTATGGAGTTYGVSGISGSTSGTGVIGEATASSGQAWGVYGKTASVGGVGVLGSALALTGTTEGVRGQSTSTTGKGLVGAAFATTGDTYGVYGESQSNAGFGVYGRGTATSGSTTGVGGETFSPLGTAVAGVAHAANGDAWGVYGATTSPAGWGVFADGGLAVNGDLVATGGKSFLTEHPTAADLSIRYACIEGGEVGVYQRGNAKLIAGAAHVALPEDFPLVASGKLTVQVTPLEACSGLYVPEASIGPDGFDVKEIGGGASNARFSYLVMAERTGFEGAEPIRHASIAERIMIAKRLNPEQRLALRGALGRAGESALQSSQRSELYQSIQRGDFDGACRVVGGCAPVSTPAPTIRERGVERADLSRTTVAAASGSGGPRNSGTPQAAPETATRSLSAVASDRASEPALRAVVAEPHSVSERVEIGDVVAVDRERVHSVRLAGAPHDSAVIGVVADVSNSGELGGEASIALVGTVLCKVDASYGPVAVGDLLAASATPGHAMRTSAPNAGTILGKALEPLDTGTGLIKVLVMPR